MSSRADIAPRLDPATVAAKDQTIRDIALEMSTGSWHQYRSVVEWAARTGLSEATLANYSKEASRLLRLAWSDDGSRVAVMERIQQLGRDAVNRTEEVVDREGKVVTLRKPDFKSAVHAAEVVASILGMTRQQHELRVTYERMSDEQLWAEAEKFLELRAAHLPEGALEDTSNERQKQVTVTSVVRAGEREPIRPQEDLPADLTA